MPNLLAGRRAATALMITLATAALCAGAVPGQAQPAGPMMGQGAATEVGIIELESSDVPFSTTVPGRAVAYEQVDIRPRVGGMISEIVYEPGRPVAAGDVLFRIEDQTYRAEVASAQADVALAEASVEAAGATVSRYESLLGTGITQEEMASAQVALKQAEADLSAARTALELAQLDLDRTEITSPIAGFPSVPGVSMGALVTEAQSDALATITRLDPIYVDVEESSRRIGEIRNKFDSGTLQRGDRLAITLTLETGETYSVPGEVVSPSASVSTTTGTSELRILFGNEERRIMPGQFLRVDMEFGTMRAVLVPQGATSRSPAGELTAFVAVDGRAEERVLEDEGSSGNAWVVTSGVEAGEALIVDGLKNLSDGAEITTVPVTISADGVVTETGTGTGTETGASASEDEG